MLKSCAYLYEGKCEILLPDVLVQHDDRIDTYQLISVSIVTLSSES